MNIFRSNQHAMVATGKESLIKHHNFFLHQTDEIKLQRNNLFQALPFFVTAGT